MNKITIAQATKMTSPNPFTLVCTEMPDGNTNLAAVSWWTYVSLNPAMVAFAMQKPAYSGERVRNNKRVLLAMPGAEIADVSFRCGTASGRDKNKAAEFGIELLEMPDTNIKAPVHSRMVFDCSLSETVETGDHYLYICTVNNIYADESKEQIFAWDGYASLRPLP